MAIETVAPIAAPTPAPAAAPAPAPEPAAAPTPAPTDDWGIQVDEKDFSSVPQDVRQSVIDPFITKIKSQVGENLKKREESFKPIKERAEVLERLVREPWFQEAYRQSLAPKAPAAPKTDAAPSISTEEWAMAYEKASQGDLTVLNKLQEKNLDLLVQQKYAPIVQQVQAQQRELKMTMEMNDLFTNHPDAKELDSIRMDPTNSRSPSLLEFALHYVSDKGGRSFEEAYQAASKMAAQMKSSAKKEAMGMVNDKKASVTETPKTANVGEESVIYVSSPQEALRNQLQATLKNQNVTYRVRPRQ